MYDFTQLSPIDFEDLVRDLLSAEFGQHIESFGPGADQGIDARFSGEYGSTIIQAKHYVKSGRSALVNNLKLEDPKVSKLKPTRYIIATSVSLNPEWKNKIIKVFNSVNIKPDDVFGQEDLNSLLRKHASVEKSHYKLWLSGSAVLDRIVHSEIYNRTDIELDIIEEMVPKFVQNNSVDEAEAILAKNGSLIISGHPGVGKTTLARMLSWLHAAQGWDVFVIDDIADAYKVPNKGGKRVVLFDDFLGQVRLSPDHVRGLDSKLPPFLYRAETDKQLRFILTTRQYILSQAVLLSHRLSDRSNANKYVLNVGIYTRSIKARILYNHIYFSGLSENHISAILEDKFFLKIIDHPNFNPRLIEILTSAPYANLERGDFKASIERILENPHELWERPFREHISEDGRALLIALLLFPRNAPLEALRSSFPRTAHAMGIRIAAAQTVYRFNSALKELEGSALYIVNDSVQFSNPGVRDYLQSVVVDDNLVPQLLANCESFREVNQCWVLSEPSRTLRPPTGSDAQIWVDALSSQRLAETMPTLDGLMLLLQIYGHFSEGRLLDLALSQVMFIDEEDFDASESDDLLAVLRYVDSLVSSGPEQAILRAAITSSIYVLLENHADEMSFDDVEELDRGLHIYGDDQARADEATRNAVRLIVEQIENEMEVYGSVEELDDFEERLGELANARGYTDSLPQEKFVERREYLEYKASESYDDYERPSRSTVSSIPPDSDLAISSMFDNLQK